MTREDGLQAFTCVSAIPKGSLRAACQDAARGVEALDGIVRALRAQVHRSGAINEEVAAFLAEFRGRAGGRYTRE